MNKLNIAIFSDTCPGEINGVAVSVKTLIDVLNRNGHNVYLFTTGDKTKIDLENHLITIGGIKLKKIYNYHFVTPIHSNVVRLCKKLNIDIIHVNTEYGVGLLGYEAAAAYKIPLVYTYHTKLENYTYYIFKKFKPVKLITLLRKLTRKYVHDSMEVIAPSLDTKNYLLSCGVRKYVNVIPTGVDLSRFYINNLEAKNELQEIREFYKIPNNYKVILCLGRLAKEKSFDLAIKYFIKFKEKNRNTKVKLLFVGDGPLRSELENLSNNCVYKNDIIFTGKVDFDHVKYFYALADVYLNVSTSETQGLTYMEAMASKTIVLTKRAKFLEGVIKEKETGFYFDTQSEFDEKLKYILKINFLEKNKIIKQSLKALEEYSLEKFYLRIMIAYYRAIRKGF